MIFPCITGEENTAAYNISAGCGISSTYCDSPRVWETASICFIKIPYRYSFRKKFCKMGNDELAGQKPFVIHTAPDIADWTNFLLNIGARTFNSAPANLLTDEIVRGRL